MIKDTKTKIVVARVLSLAMIAVFIILGIIVKQSSEPKHSTIKLFEKGKEVYSESDFLLFEEDDEVADDNEDGQELLKEFTFGGLSEAHNSHVIARDLNIQPYLFLHKHTLIDPIPVFISVRSLRI